MSGFRFQYKPWPRLEACPGDYGPIFSRFTHLAGSMDLATVVYRLTGQFPQREMYGIVSQMRRCAVSIPSNIAEGHGRLALGEYRQFLGIARASNFELQTQLEIAHRLGYANPSECQEAESLSNEVGKMIYSILEKTRGPRPASKSRIV